jgi:hypothetical protein
MAIITPKMNMLQIPIEDEFYVPPSDPASLHRTNEFAREKGLLNPPPEGAAVVESKTPVTATRRHISGADSGSHCC